MSGDGWASRSTAADEVRVRITSEGCWADSAVYVDGKFLVDVTRVELTIDPAAKGTGVTAVLTIEGVEVELVGDMHPPAADDAVA